MMREAKGRKLRRKASAASVPLSLGERKNHRTERDEYATKAALAAQSVTADNMSDGLPGAENRVKRRLAYITVSTAILAIGCTATMLFAKEPADSQKRAKPPKWPADVLDAFYPDARTKLVGTRPDYEHSQAIADAGKNSDKTEPGATKTAGGWSKLIDAETIETEIKRTSPELAKVVKSPGEFKGGGYKECRRDFSVLATLFALSAEYDGDIRWQDAAPALRDLFSRAGHNCKSGSDQTFQEAVQRKQDLADLIAGTRPKGKEAERKADWPKVADRPPLMQRMNIAHEDRLKKWMANKGEFTAHHDDVKHEAQLVAAIADIIGREGFEFADDEKYTKCAQELREAATDVSAAVDTDNLGRAQQAGNRMTKACADCHEGFRS